jgi:peptidoglycan/LPS O-acetylase OafA/YrhL
MAAFFVGTRSLVFRRAFYQLQVLYQNRTGQHPETGPQTIVLPACICFLPLSIRGRAAPQAGFQTLLNRYTSRVKDKPNLDLLRSIAITLVVVDHLLLSKGIETWRRWSVGEIGLFGVYLFFVHTSLVLMWSLERRPNTLDFYVRRIFRIYPLAILTILLAAFTHAPVSGIDHVYFRVQPWTLTSLITNCLLLQEFFQNLRPIHAVTWSLPPEVFMYALLPCLFFYARTMRKIWPLLIIWLVVVIVDRREFSLVGNWFPVLVPDFLAGVIAYVGFMHRKPKLPSWTLIPILAILFAVTMSVHRIRADWYTCLALGLVLPSIKQLQMRIPKQIAQSLATYSYGVYLFHTFGIVLGMYVLAGRSFILQLAVVLSFTAITAFLSYHLLERPMIQLGARVAANLAGERGLPANQTLDSLEPAP